jgi:hypothetical protein
MRTRVLIFMLSAAFLLTTGCASFHLVGAKYRLPDACVATAQRLDIALTKYVLTVNIAEQKASLFENIWLVKTYRCSTSRFGVGQIEGSYRTPLGLHCIAEKIGDGEPAGTIFKERRVVGHVSELGVKAGGITTRILWLKGLEPGFNQGGSVDTHAREIYIHGTGDQASVGKPTSIGCIHFADPDLVSLFNLLPAGTLVWIAEK